MRKVIPIIPVFLILILVTCNREKQPLLPKVTGKPGEVIVVADPYIWDSEIGKSLNSILTQPFDALPQVEPSFDPIRISSSAFTNIFKSHRNIIIAKISPRNKKPRILVQRDVWAKPQIVINLFGADDSTTVEYLKMSGEKLLNLLDQAEINRTIINYRKNRAKGIDDSLRVKHQVSISVPMGYQVGVDSSDFVWISHELSDITQAILIYQYAYTDTNTFTPEYLINKRNEFTRKYVPGPVIGSFMIVEPSYPVSFHEYTKDNLYCAELRGLWKLENAFMGGPFINISLLDEKRNRVVTVDAFVYAPSLDKRNYVREVEAILNTFKIISE
jgi:hypothetical protein